MPNLRPLLTSLFLLLCVDRLDAQLIVPIKNLTAGSCHACALMENGNAKCWGDGGSGELGQDSYRDIGDGPNEMGNNLPVIDFGTGKTAVQLAAGDRYTCALLDDGNVKCWGSCNSGRLGNGQQSGLVKTPPYAAVDLGTGKTAVQLAAGNTHACALLNDGAAKCWGVGGTGQLGQGNADNIGDSANEMGDNLPVIEFGTGKTAVQLVAGHEFTCALLNDGNVKCWGNGNSGKLGQGNTNHIGDNPNQMGDNLPAVDLGTGKTAVQLTAGDYHVCAVLNDGTAKCWGSNNHGQLGQGNTDSIGDDASEMGDNLPVVDLGTGKTAVQLAASEHLTCALLNDGNAKCWGEGNVGQLGQGNTNNIGDGASEMGDNLPVIELGTNKDAVQLVNGGGVGQWQCSFTCALLNDGNAKCWGSGNVGQLGQGNTNNVGDGANEMGDNLPIIDMGTVSWTTCQAGERVAVNGTATVDRQCGACPAETLSATTNQQSCTPWTTCQAGERITVNGTATVDRQCGAWSNCTAGERVIANGTATDDRQCGACPAGTFTSEMNRDSCTTWSNCTAGERVIANGTAMADRQCGACPAETYTSSVNGNTCQPWTVCTAGEKVVASGTATEDRQCAEPAQNQLSSATRISSTVYMPFLAIACAFF
jgi:alpha-tubulin suppressor-like RCC1 family protein